MTSETAPVLPAVAALYGVETTWLDNDGTTHVVPDGTLRAVLASLGVAAESSSDLAEAARARRHAVWTRFCPPAVIAEAGRGAEIPLRVPAAAATGPLRWSLAFEAAGGGRSDVVRLDTLPLAGGRRYDGEAWEVRRLRLPSDVPAGFHRLRVSCGRRLGRANVVVGPRRAWLGGGLDGRWGLFHPLYGLGDPDSGEPATLQDARRALEWCSARGAAVYGTTPLLASFDEPPVDPSPYAPASRLFWNDAYLHLASLPGWGELPSAVRDGLPPSGETVPWDDVHRRQAPVLAELAARFFDAGGNRDAAFLAWAAGRPEAGDYARFRAAGTVWGRDWRTWPAAARSGRLDEGELPARAVQRHVFAQWQADRQVAAASESSRAGLYLDIPLGTSADGYDVWRHQAQFVSGASIGAPPDEFFPTGQDWGLPPPDPRELREDGYEYFAAVLGHTMRPARLVRIDHVMQVERLFWIPKGLDPVDGAYVRYPADELASVVALASHRWEAEVVGEDLGTVSTRVRDLMAERGFRRSWVYGFDLSAPPDVPAGAVASLGTHDMFPLAGLREARDIAVREALGVLLPPAAATARERRRVTFADLDEQRLGSDASPPAATVDGPRGGTDPDPLLPSLLAELAESEAGLVMVALDDLVGVAEAHNVPGTGADHPNWRRRLGRGVESLSPAALRVIAGLREKRTGSAVVHEDVA